MITPSLSSSSLLQHMCVFSIILLLLFWDFEGIKNHSWCIAGSLSPCTSNLFVLRCLLCSKKPANWPIFKFHISNVFLSKFYFPSTVHCIFSAWEREPGEILTLIEFYWIILFSGWALPSFKQSIFQCIFIKKKHIKLFEQFVKGLLGIKTWMKTYWLIAF